MTPPLRPRASRSTRRPDRVVRVRRVTGPRTGARAGPAQAPAPLPPRPDPRSPSRAPHRRASRSPASRFTAPRRSAARRWPRCWARTASSWLPWGRKRYFDRAVFDADLRRIEAYYADRGYPDAKVTAFDAKLNDTQDAIALSITVQRGRAAARRPRRRSRASTSCVQAPARRLRPRLPLQPGALLDRAQVTATQAMAARARCRIAAIPSPRCRPTRRSSRAGAR